LLHHEIGYYHLSQKIGRKSVAFRLFTAVALSWAVAACTSEPTIHSPDPFTRASAVAVAMPGFITSAETVLRWRSDLIWVDDPEGRYERRADMLQLALEDEFERKGYTFVGAGEPANYDVLAVALLGDIQGHEELEETFRMYPSLSSSSQGYKRGTVLVALAPAGTKIVVWRGALEIFTDPGMEKISIREQRMQWGARQVLSSIPNYQ
jgi:hypothetical protein